jgi:hypothetical protein
MTDINGSSAESGLMRATAKNIEGLQRAVVELQAAAAAAKVDALEAKLAATQAKEEARRWKALTRFLGAVALVALVASGLSIYNWVRAADATNQLRSQAIAACEQGNSERAAEVGVWDHVLSATLAGSQHETPEQRAATVAFVKDTERVLASKLAARDCTKAYSPVQAEKGN